jgi:glutathione S-transferase
MSLRSLARSDAPYRFHAFEVSYFSAKVRPALRYKGVWYEERRADLTEIRRRTGLAFIPVVITPDDETWQDSTDIYDQLERRHPKPPLFPSGPLQRIAAHLIEVYADEFALLPAMHYRWASELGEATARARFSAMMGSRERGNKAADRMVRARFMLGASVEAGPAIEQHTRDVLDALSAHFEVHPYLLGARLSFGDCALMGPIDGHFFTDLVSRRLLLETAVPVVGWIERCRFPNEDQQGEWLAADALAPSLVDALGVMGRDAVPVILDTVRAVEEWSDSRPEELVEPPRSVGSCKSSLRGIGIERAALSYSLFSVQRVLDYYRSLEQTERAQIDAALAGCGWTELLGYQPRHRLCKQNFKLVFEPQGGGTPW